MAEASARGYAVHVMDFDRLDDIPVIGGGASVLVCSRRKRPFGGRGRNSEYPAAPGCGSSHIDDLVFDPSYADRIDALRRMGPYQRASHRSDRAPPRAAARLRSVTVSTAPLAKIAERLGVRPPSFRIRSTASRCRFRRAGGCAAAPA